VLTAVNFAAQRCALHQDIFQPKAKTFVINVPSRGQFQLRLFHPECPFQRCLHAQRALCACAAIVDRPLHGHRTPRIRSRSGVTRPRTNMASRVVLLIVLTGR
jgi:hypothetical protein